MATAGKTIDPLRTARVVSILTWLWLLADILLAVQSLFTIYALGGLGSPISHDMAVLSDDWGPPAGIASMATFALAGIAILRWIFVVNRNAHALGGAMTMTPSMNVVWFFIPIGNLWKPFAGVRESWQATLNPAAPARVPVPGIMRTWWAAWLISSLAGNVAGRLGAAAKTAEQIVNSNWLLAASTPVDIAAGVTLLRIVRRLSRLQSRALARRDPEAPASAGDGTAALALGGAAP